MSKSQFNVDNKRSNNRQKKEIPFKVTFHPKFKVPQNLINKYLYLLYLNYEVKRVFISKGMVSFRSFCKIISYLVEKNYILLKEQWIHLNVGVNDVKTSLKLILLLVVSMEKHVKLIIAWTVMKNFLCTFLLVTKVKKTIHQSNY